MPAAALLTGHNAIRAPTCAHARVHTHKHARTPARIERLARQHALGVPCVGLGHGGLARALQHLGRRDRLAAAYRVRQREHALVGVVQRGGGIGRRAWLCKRTTFTPRQTSIGSLFAQWLSGSWTVRSASEALACAHARRSVPHATVRAWDYDNAAHGTTACGRTGGGMPCGGRKQHSVGAYEPKGRSRRTAGAPGAHPRRSTARGRRALGARSAPHRMRIRRQPSHAAHHVRHAKALARRRRRRV